MASAIVDFAETVASLSWSQTCRASTSGLLRCWARLFARFGGTTANVVFDGVERGNAHQRFSCNRRRRGDLNVVEFPPRMAPTKCEHDIAGLGKLDIGSIAIDL